MRGRSILQPSAPYRERPKGRLIRPERYGPEPYCFVTGATQGLDCHHIYFGDPGRRISDENGFWVYLRHDVHMALHERRFPCEFLDQRLKVRCQEAFEDMGHTREEFVALVGRSYII